MNYTKHTSSSTKALSGDSKTPSLSAPSSSPPAQKKKICLQNVSDGIKHLFQTDSAKTCQYLLQLCSDQHKFHLQMKARQNNQELQELGTPKGNEGREMADDEPAQRWRETVKLVVTS